MKPISRLLALAFIESFSTICIERGLFFYAHVHLQFSEAANLWLSLCFGSAYVLGALTSHRVCLHRSEKSILVGSIAALLVCHVLAVPFARHAVALYLLNTAIGWLNGTKWPVIESYVAAGRRAEDNVTAIGRFNIAWAAAVPLAVSFTGPVNACWPVGLFVAPAVLNAVSLLLCAPLRSSPEHLEGASSLHIDEARLTRMYGLMRSARWLMLLAYACMWVLAALMPAVLNRLQLRDSTAPAFSSALDVCRLATFIALQSWHGWVSRRTILILSAIALPASFLTVLCSPTLIGVLAGEIIFGVCTGTVYTAALYYALVVKNASVDAGGAHEALIGAGFTLGPLMGLAAGFLLPVVGSRFAATTLATAPLTCFCLVMAFRNLRTPPRPSAPSAETQN